MNFIKPRQVKSKKTSYACPSSYFHQDTFLVLTDDHRLDMIRTAPAGLGIADTHVTSSSLQHGVVTSSLSPTLSSRTVPLSRGEI